MRSSENTLLTFIMIVAMATWGLSWTNGKLLANFSDVSVPVLMVWRFLIAGISMWVVLVIQKAPWKISRAGILPILGSAVFLILYNHFYFTGTRYGSAGAGGVLVTTLNPLLTFLLISLIQRKMPRGKALMGIMLGIFGGTLLLNVWVDGWSALFVSGNQYFVMCAMTWAFLTWISASISKHMSTLTYSFWLYLTSSVLSLLLIGDAAPMVVFHYGWDFWWNLLSISVGAMAFATTAYFIATSKLGGEKASAFIFTVPLSAMLFSMIILHEPLRWNVLIGGTFSVLAVILINSVKKKSTEPTINPS